MTFKYRDDHIQRYGNQIIETMCLLNDLVYRSKLTHADRNHFARVNDHLVKELADLLGEQPPDPFKNLPKGL